MKRILLCTDGSIFSHSSYEYAAWVARPSGAMVEVLYVTDARKKAAVEARNFSGSLPAGASQALLNQLVALEQEKAKLDHEQAKLILQDAERILTGNAIEDVKLIHETGYLLDYLHRLEVDADLIILGKRGETSQFAAGHLGSNVERIIRASSQPCLVTSAKFTSPERLLLAYDGSPSCQKMLQFLIDLPVFKALVLHIVTVAKHSEEETAIACRDEARKKAKIGGLEPICRVIEGHPEVAISQYAKDNTIDLLMMGAYGHNRIRHLVIGSTTTQILQHIDLPVLLFR
ncbi:MAG: universal stress protein [Cyanobacteria bacterium SBLK]|nr:universal stress protein [Cyanobacteria bacterium SBLK]